jgi:alpha-beta hydrolase superfamily lysophospholipase
LAGLALLAPAFGVHPSINPGLKEIAAAAITGDVSFETDDRLGPSTSSQAFIKARKQDKLALHKVRVSYLLAIANLQNECREAAAKIKLPLFIGMAGKDQVIDPAAVQQFYKRAGTPKGKKARWEWPKGYHTLC